MEGASDETGGGGGRVGAGDGDETAESEVGDVWLEVGVEEDVGWFDVSVHELSWAAFVEIRQASRRTLCDS